MEQNIEQLKEELKIARTKAKNLGDDAKRMMIEQTRIEVLLGLEDADYVDIVHEVSELVKENKLLKEELAYERSRNRLTREQV